MAFIASAKSPAKEARLIKPASRYSANISRSFADANQRHNDAREEWVLPTFQRERRIQPPTRPTTPYVIDSALSHCLISSHDNANCFIY
jgi:hypothetical protein